MRYDVVREPTAPLCYSLFHSCHSPTLRRVDQIPLWAQIGAIFLLLLCSSFFSISETAMMALNRHRLKHLAGRGALGAKTTQGLLARTDQLLSVILIGNNLFNTIIPVLTTSIALRTFGHDNFVLSIATGIVAFLIIVFAEITPKIVGATFPERIALPASVVIAPLMRVMMPVVWFVNTLSGSILAALRINTKGGATSGCRPRSCARSCSNRAASCRPSTAASCSTCSISRTSPSTT